MKSQTFGIEIEMTGITREHAARVIATHFSTAVEYVGGTYDTRVARDQQGRAWKVVSDSSIADTWERQTEVVSPICRWEDIETVQELTRKLRAAGAKAHESCGIHVHIGLGEAARRAAIFLTLRHPLRMIPVIIDCVRCS